MWLLSTITLSLWESQVELHVPEICRSLCKELRVKVAFEKCEGPAVYIVFLRIELDSMKMEMWIPSDKLEHLKETTSVWCGCKACSKRELLSLVCQLSHACKVVKPGRIFLCQMIRLSTVPKQPHCCVCLNKGFRCDLEWWHLFLEWCILSVGQQSSLTDSYVRCFW